MSKKKDLWRKIKNLRSGYYMARLLCLNCHEMYEIEIPKGHIIETYISIGNAAICTECGCKGQMAHCWEGCGGPE